MQLIYISSIKIPANKMPGYQIAKMCEAFAEAGFNVSLWLLSQINGVEKDIFSFYNIKQIFDVRYIKSRDFLRNFSFLITLLFIKIPKDAIIYTRNPEIVFLFNIRGRKVIYEDHGWPKRTRFYLYLVLSAYKIIAISQAIKDQYESRGIVHKKILVAPDIQESETYTWKKRASSILYFILS